MVSSAAKPPLISIFSPEQLRHLNFYLLNTVRQNIAEEFRNKIENSTLIKLIKTASKVI